MTGPARTWAQGRAAALKFLRSQQRPDGGFDGWAGPAAAPFEPKRPQPAVFPTILILNCLTNVKGAADICDKAAKFVLAQMGTSGSWNYWQVDSLASEQEPYPDDLDDTACAVAALATNLPEAVGAVQLGRFARLLTTAESRPGGPYNTWLVDTKQQPAWLDVDLAVNANIGFALAGQGVSLTGLEAYINDQIEADAYSSKYYVGEAPLLYFLARWYRGPALSQLQKKLASSLADSHKATYLEQALLLSAAGQLEWPVERLRDLAKSLLQGQADGRWPAAAFYVDPVYDGQQYYSGSAALTTAFGLEALTTYNRLVRDAKLASVKNTPIVNDGLKPSRPSLLVDYPAATTNTPTASLINKQALQTITDLPLRQSYSTKLLRLAERKNGEQIANAAGLIAAAGNWPLAERPLNCLNLASLNGWLAYSLYDDFLDDDSQQPALLNVANLALRRSYDYYLQALPGDADWRSQVTATFDAMDSANSWELRVARANISHQELTAKRLPDYGSLAILAKRSWGHSLAARAVFRAAKGLITPALAEALEQFFKDYLIARQLNDDGHDWKEDLLAGRLTPVVVWLLQNRPQPTKINLAKDLVELEQLFWLTVLDQVAAAVEHHVKRAHKAINKLNAIMDTTIFSDWLDALEASTQLALEQRQASLEFIKAYHADG